ncbi:MAG: DUF1800 domain-containing protein [Pseudomonadota bacterium]
MQETGVAQIRFGYGFGPYAAPVTRAELLSDAVGPDQSAKRFPGLHLTEALDLGQAIRAANKDRQRGALGAQRRYKAARDAVRDAGDAGVKTALARVVDAKSPFRERLTWFWADHFTVAPQNLFSRATALSFIDDAIRPNILNSFSEMLKAVIRHPSMLIYLDQHRSIGPQSLVGKRTGRGLNENLARELLELHTMGVGTGYTQDDVRAAAELLTGLSFDMDKGFVFRRHIAQPGPDTVLGKSYGAGQRASIADIDAFLEDLALRPETGQHLARKLAVHFIADAPPAALVSDLALAYDKSGGDLGAMTAVLMAHSESATSTLRKVKTPFEFIASALIALGFQGRDIEKFEAQDLRRMVLRPMAGMGQPFMRPPGPDGWPEDPAHWITPQGLATRITWAVAVADKIGNRVGDPRFFLERTLGAVGAQQLRFAVSAAETQAEGIALVLASAEFNRR